MNENNDVNFNGAATSTTSFPYATFVDPADGGVYSRLHEIERVALYGQSSATKGTINPNAEYLSGLYRVALADYLGQ